MKNSIIAKREDGYTIRLSTFSDFKRLQKLVKNLSEESKCLFTPWLFDENPKFKVRIGQTIAKLSLIPIIGNILKKILPRGFIIILIVESPQQEVVGFVYLYNFKKMSDGSFYVTHGDVIADSFQGKGLGTFQRIHMQELIKNEKIKYVEANIFGGNEKSFSFFKKNGYKIEKVEENILQPCGKRHDVVKFIRNFKIHESQPENEKKIND